MEIKEVSENVLQVHLNGKYCHYANGNYVSNVSFLPYESKFTYIFQNWINNLKKKIDPVFNSFYFSIPCTIIFENKINK